MPNHVTNILTINGKEEEVKRLFETIKGEDREIDFEKIIPMPQSMNITSGSQTDTGLAIILFKERGDGSKLKPMLEYPWVKAENIKTLDELADFLIENGRANLEEGKIALDNLEEHNHKDWYSWSIANWGTKWNAYDIVVESDNKIMFDTAWSTPYPVIEKLSRMFPELEITLEFADEDFGYNCGIVIFLGGGSVSEDVPAGGSPEAYAVAAKVKGTDIDMLMHYVCDGEDESYITNMLNTISEIFSMEELVDEVENSGVECSETFLETLKSFLIENEMYELIGSVDKMLEEK